MAGAPRNESWHARPAAHAIAALDTSRERGLDGADAARRLESAGHNEIARTRVVSPLAILAAQFQSFLVLLLLGAAALSLAVGLLPGREPEYAEALLIAAIVVANGVFGFLQDYRAEKAMESLRAMATPEAHVLRDGRPISVQATDVVPGDILLVAQGDRVAADARLIESHGLETMEASLTGESGNVAKHVDAVDEGAPLAERRSLLFMHTDVVRGRGVAVVVATGMGTEVGAIAADVAAAERRPTPFQQEIDALGRRLGWFALGVIAVVAVVEYAVAGTGLVTTLMLAISLAVAAVPEGLPAVVTLTLALGSRRLARQRVLIRRISVVESLGSVDVIVTDKTGTLTENRMTVRQVYMASRVYEVSGEGLETRGEFRHEGRSVDPTVLAPLLWCGAVANDATADGEGGDRFSGDPTEVALLVSAMKAGIAPRVERVREVPFSSDRKRMTVVVRGEKTMAYMKGAPEVVLDRCDRVWRDGRVAPLDDEMRDQIRRRNDAFASAAFRVLACAHREIDRTDVTDDALEQDLVFLGLQALIDPPREEVPGAVEDCRRAGIKVIMVTGDNLATARAIGAQIGFDSAAALSGSDLDRLSPGEVAAAVERVEVFARVSPGHKVKLLRALQDAGHRVAMTGDGVNDAPALRSADVGVAMGLRGTEVAKEAADMVLQDDNFATLRNAIAEGRGIFDNIRKFVTFLLSANAGEVLIVFWGVLVASVLFAGTFGAGREALILTPAMLLWINMVTDGLPALALGTDPVSPGIMARPPRPSDEPIIDRGVLGTVLAIGVALTVAGLPLFFLALPAGIAEAQTLLFTFVVAGEMAVLQLVRSRYGQPWRSNPRLLAAVTSSLVLQGLVLYTPLAGAFGVAVPELPQWGWMAAALGAFMVLAVAGVRWCGRPARAA